MKGFRRVVIVVSVLAVGAVSPAVADPVKCQKIALSQLRKFKKIYLKASEKCLDSENIARIPGPCPDPTAQLKIQGTHDKVAAKIGAVCTMADIAALGFPSNCAFEPGAAGAEGQCAALPVTTATEFAQCLECWKAAELAEYVAITYASHALETCNGDLGDTSSRCSDLDCSTPLPDQRNLGDTAENDCQKAIGKAAVNYLLTREKTLEKCALAGGTSASCAADPKVQLTLQKAETRKHDLIRKFCGNRHPLASPSFCCRTGTGNACSVVATREDCLAISGAAVQEGKFCDVGNTCSPVTGGGSLTWWQNCPESNTCPGADVSTIEDVIDCVDTSADAIVDELLCQQLPGGGWPCPSPGSPNGAFLD